MVDRCFNGPFLCSYLVNPLGLSPHRRGWQRVEVDDRADQLQPPILPGRHLIERRVGHRRHQVRRDLDGVQLAQVRLDPARAQTSGVERDDLLVEDREDNVAFPRLFGVQTRGSEDADVREVRMADRYASDYVRRWGLLAYGSTGEWGSWRTLCAGASVAGLFSAFGESIGWGRV